MMSKYLRAVLLFTAIGILCGPVSAQQGTRGGGQEGAGIGGEGYREGADYVIKQLKLRRNSVIVDIGAGDGWWSSKMAEKLGPKGVIRAAEIEQKKVDTMKQKWQAMPQIKPYLCPTDGTGLDANSVDLAFISKTYHHFAEGTKVDYLRHLGKVVRPSGRLVIIERHADLADVRGKEHAGQPGSIAYQAEQAGWMLLQCQMIPGSDHFMAIFVKPDAFAKQLAKRPAQPKTRQGERKQ